MSLLLIEQYYKITKLQNYKYVESIKSQIKL